MDTKKRTIVLAAMLAAIITPGAALTGAAVTGAAGPTAAPVTILAEGDEDDDADNSDWN